MKLSEWNDAQCSRWIAEKLEPPPISYDAVPPCNSQLGIWFRVHDGSGKSPSWWKPRDMVADPAMTVMLLEKMLFNAPEGIVFSLSSDRRNTYCVFPHNGNQGRGVIGRAVAEAFMLANGWTE